MLDSWFGPGLAYAEAHWLLLALSSLAVFLAAVVRGFSGFGFSLLAITAISIFMPAREIVPSAFLLEIAASLNLIPSIWRHVDWRGMIWLVLGYVLALPFGVYALAQVPAPPLQLALGVFVIATAVLMLKGFHLKKTPGPAAIVAAGAGSGLLNGAFGMGGPPVVLFYFSTRAAAEVGRASVIAFFLTTDILGSLELARNGLVTGQSFIQAAVWLPALLLGVAVGAHGFRHMDPDKFRRWVLVILIGLAAVTLVKAGIELAA
jgi:uncharacterized membrane protein YfcA